jgi:hypothetical protein
MRKMKADIWASITNDQLQRDAPNGTYNRLLPIVIPSNEIGTQLATQWKTFIDANAVFADLRLVSAYTCGRNLSRSLV